MESKAALAVMALAVVAIAEAVQLELAAKDMERMAEAAVAVVIVEEAVVGWREKVARQACSRM